MEAGTNWKRELSIVKAIEDPHPEDSLDKVEEDPQSEDPIFPLAMRSTSQMREIKATSTSEGYTKGDHVGLVLVALLPRIEDNCPWPSLSLGGRQSPSANFLFRQRIIRNSQCFLDLRSIGSELLYISSVSINLPRPRHQVSRFVFTMEILPDGPKTR